MNRKPFNRSGFNRPNIQTVGNSGLALMKLGANSVFANRYISSLPTSATIKLTNIATQTNVKYSAGTSVLILKNLTNATKVLDSGVSTADIVLITSANQSVQGEASITLQGLILKPGDELIINTNDMTVTINNQNGMQYFSADSNFFTLLSGENTIVYTDTVPSRKANIDVIWKDRWL